MAETEKNAAVTNLRLVFSNPDREPPLTDLELVRLRHLLAVAEKICTGCPMARHLMEVNG